MSRVVWSSVLVATFIVGWAAGHVVRTTSPPSREAPADQETVTRLRQQVETLQARLRAREGTSTTGEAGAPAARETRPGAAAGAGIASSRTEAGRGADSVMTPAPQRSASATAVGTPSVQGALDRFYRYLELVNTTAGGRERWRQAREVIEELRAMGAPAGEALKQVLATGTDSDERRAAARLLGQLQVASALPVLKDVLERDQDVLLRRAAASGLRQLQTPESIPVMERLLAQPGEDRFVRLSAAVGLTDSGKPLGVAALTQIFDEATADGRGRDVAFRALNNLKDERSVPFMRHVAASPVEPGYRLQAIRYLAAQGDQQSLATLHALMHAPNEQPSIRDAAAQAHAAISGARKAP
jgi:hypothetical protein